VAIGKVTMLVYLDEIHVKFMWVGMIEIEGNSAKDEPQIPTTS